MLFDQIHFMFNLVIGMFIIRYIQMMLKPGPSDNALGWLFH